MGSRTVNYGLIEKLKNTNPVPNADSINTTDINKPAIYKTTIRGCKYTVLENGNIVPNYIL